jgi:hypothetical protein
LDIILKPPKTSLSKQNFAPKSGRDTPDPAGTSILVVIVAFSILNINSKNFSVMSNLDLSSISSQLTDSNEKILEVITIESKLLESRKEHLYELRNGFNMQKKTLTIFFNIGGFCFDFKRDLLVNYSEENSFFSLL